MGNWILYLDESGNTGTNLSDEKQTIFVYGGWLINKKDILRVQRYVRDNFSKCNAKELKSTNVIKRYKKDLYAFLKGALLEDMYPFFLAANKTDIILVHVVEMFFDYAHNHSIDLDFTFDFSHKRDIVDSLYDNTTIIELMAELIKEGSIDIDKTRRLKDELSIELLKKDYKYESNAIVNLSDSELLDMVDEYELLNSNNNHVKLSPINPSIFAIMYNVNVLMRMSNDSVDIIRDRIYSKKTFEDIDKIVANKRMFPYIDRIRELTI